MAALAERITRWERTAPRRECVFATTIPTLWPHMALPRARPAVLPYPFDHPRVHYFYFARNGVYQLARLLSLTDQEVLFPAYFHGVELEALLAAGVRLKFFPVRDRMRIHPEEVISEVGPQTKAIYLTHYVGFPGPVERLSEVCRERGLLLIEDCALALLSSLGNRPLGSFGDASVFCLYKTVPTPNGGAVVINREGMGKIPAGAAPSLVSAASHSISSLLSNLEMRAGAVGRLLRQTSLALSRTAMRAANAERVATGTQHFDAQHVHLAMSAFSRTILQAQDFTFIIQQRRENYLRLLDQLRDLSPPVFDELPAGVCPLFYPFQTHHSQEVVERLKARGVGAGSVWSVGHAALPPGVFPEVDHLRRTIIWLPCHQDLSFAAIDRMAALVREVVKEVK
jgi:dTDP-4-amino-4,6-dideoxygalactose transaminase